MYSDSVYLYSDRVHMYSNSVYPYNDQSRKKCRMFLVSWASREVMFLNIDLLGGEIIYNKI